MTEEMVTIHCRIPKSYYDHVKFGGRDKANRLLREAIRADMDKTNVVRESLDTEIGLFCTTVMKVMTNTKMKRRWLTIKQIRDLAIKEPHYDTYYFGNDEELVAREAVWKAVNEGMLRHRKNKRNYVFQYVW